MQIVDLADKVAIFVELLFALVTIKAHLLSHLVNLLHEIVVRADAAPQIYEEAVCLKLQTLALLLNPGHSNATSLI